MVEVMVMPGIVVVLGGNVIGGVVVLEGGVVVGGGVVHTIPPDFATGSVHIGAVVSVVKVGPGSPDGAEYVSVDVGADNESGQPAVPR